MAIAVNVIGLGAFMIILFDSTASSTSTLTAGKLLDKLLLTNYEKRAIPRHNDTGKALLKLSLVIDQLNEMRDRKQELHWAGYVRVIWNDPRLKWDPAEHDGITHLFVKESDIWVPDICIIERLDDDIGFKDQRRRLIYLTYEGDLKWILGGDLIVTRCPLNVQKFPFDKQVCYMHVGSYVIPYEDLIIVDSNQSMYSNMYAHNALWRVTGTEASLITQTYVSGLGLMRYDYLLFKIYIERKSSYFVVTIIAPLVLMSGLMLVTFLLPPDGGEKVGFGITLLLAFNVIQLVITENMPQTSDSLPVISVYVTILLALSALLLPISVVVIFIHHYGFTFFPKFIRKLMETSPEPLRIPSIYATTNHSFSDEQNVRHADMDSDKNSNEIDKIRDGVYAYIYEELRRKRRAKDEKKDDNDRQERHRRSAKKVDLFCMKLFAFFLITMTVSCIIAMNI